jgi:hypothetical protein
VAIAEAGRRGEVRYLGEVDTSEAAANDDTSVIGAAVAGPPREWVNPGSHPGSFCRSVAALDLMYCCSNRT